MVTYGNVDTLDVRSSGRGGHLTVGVEESAVARAALAWAAREAGSRDADLTICHVPGDGTADAATAGYVRDVRQHLAEHRIDLDVRTGDVAASLLEQSHHSDLVVVGAASGDRASSRTASRVAAHAACPVAVVRPVDRCVVSPYRDHVVVGVDGSRTGRAAARFAFAYADLHRLPVVAVHADADASPKTWYDDRMLDSYFAPEPAPLRLVSAETAAAASRYPGVRLVRAVLGGPPADALKRASAGAQALVVGRRGHRTPSAMRLGSTSAACVVASAGVVVVVPLFGPVFPSSGYRSA